MALERLADGYYAYPRTDPVDGMQYYPPALDLGPKLLASEEIINDLMSRLHDQERLMFLLWLAKRCPGNDLLDLLASILHKQHGVELHISLHL